MNIPIFVITVEEPEDHFYGYNPAKVEVFTNLTEAKERLETLAQEYGAEHCTTNAWVNADEGIVINMTKH